MINPTGGKVRIDAQGSGYFGAPRGNRLHQGVDLECVPGQSVYSPITGKILRIAYPYEGDKEFTGCVVENSRITIKMFYMQPTKKLIGKRVTAGQVIGFAQDIAKKYGIDSGMLPHVHLEIEKVDPLYFLEMP